MGYRKEISYEPLALRAMPHSLEAEKAVLGAMLLDKEAIDKVVENNFEPADFYRDLHRRIFETIIDIYNQHKPVDILTVTESLRSNNIVPDDGEEAAAYVVSLLNTVTTAANVDYYIEIIKEKSILRKIIRVASEMIENSLSGVERTDTILDKAEQDVLDIRAKKSSDFIHVKDLVIPMLDRLEMAAKDKKEVTGLATGIHDFDILTCGLQPANLIIIAGRPGMGKTSLAMNFAEHIAIELKKAVAIFSLEMSKEELMLRFLCSRGKIDSQKAKKGYIGKREWPILTTVGSIFAEAPLYIDDTSTGNILEVKSRARKLYKELRRKGSELSLIIIDYLQLLHTPTRAESRQQEIAEISRALKRLAMELHIPVLAVSQLSRKPEERGREGKPQLSDLRESGAIEQDADLVAFVYRESCYKRDLPEDEKRKAKIMVMKQRNGPTGDIDVVFLSEFTRFDNLDKAHAEL